MPYQVPITIKTALDRISKHDYVLPAIQREFVWKPEQIYRLFDSLMQGFPVGSFLFWKIEQKTSTAFQFFDFSREYHQRDNPHCPALGKLPKGPVTAVLDGQQRLTALISGCMVLWPSRNRTSGGITRKRFRSKSCISTSFTSQNSTRRGNYIDLSF